MIWFKKNTYGNHRVSQIHPNVQFSQTQATFSILSSTYKRVSLRRCSATMFTYYIGTMLIRVVEFSIWNNRSSVLFWKREKVCRRDPSACACALFWCTATAAQRYSSHRIYTEPEGRLLKIPVLLFIIVFMSHIVYINGRYSTVNKSLSPWS